ncbi:MAG: F0F1 ATP synthase subunit A [Rhodothermales bacterium]|nr:F0F1 ATP synthase subunit A [Rhodothermales bacterium]
MTTQPQRALRLWPLLLALVVLAPALASPARAAGDGEELDAIGHTMDGNYLDFSPIGKIELPRLFLVRQADGSLGFETFGSTKAALLSGRYVIDDLHAGDAYGDDAVGDEEPLSDDVGDPAFGAGEPTQHELTVTQEVYTEEFLAGYDYLHGGIVRAEGAVLVDFSITRHLLFAVLAAVLLLALFLPAAAKYKRGIGRTEAPRGLLQNMLETLVVYIRDEIARPNLGPKTDRYLPYILTVFFFILTCNLLGLVPFGATATANISTTAILAFFTFVVTQIAGTKDYWLHIFNPPGIPWFVKPILVPIEFLGLFIKPFALAIRLFANMTAGHLVILNLIGLIFAIGALFGDVAGYGTSIPSLGLTLFIYLLEILVAFIQAYVFTILSALFIGMAAAEHEHHGEEHHAPDAHDAAVAASAPIIHGDGHPLEEKTIGTEGVLSPA